MACKLSQLYHWNSNSFTITAVRHKMKYFSLDQNPKCQSLEYQGCLNIRKKTCWNESTKEVREKLVPNDISEPVSAVSVREVSTTEVGRPGLPNHRSGCRFTDLKVQKENFQDTIRGIMRFIRQNFWSIYSEKSCDSMEGEFNLQMKGKGPFYSHHKE